MQRVFGMGALQLECTSVQYGILGAWVSRNIKVVTREHVQIQQQIKQRCTIKSSFLASALFPPTAAYDRCYRCL
jgi:hypothetical protein